MTRLPHVLFVGAYRHKSRTSSMEFYLRALEQQWRDVGGESTVLYPRARLGGFAFRGDLAHKLAGVVDKLVLFPFELRREVRRLRKSKRPFVVHVIDQAYANYAGHLQDVPHLVTCHDLLSLQASRGEIPEHRESMFTRLYQAMLLRGLRRAQHLVAVSKTTASILQRLTGRDAAGISTVYNDLHHPFAPTPPEEAAQRVARLLNGARPPRFLLHVGINIWYKNRSGVLEIFARLQQRHPDQDLHLIMVGHLLPEALQAYAEAQGIAGRIHVLSGIATEDLQALYSSAEALLFPSLYEGFGWPIIEAMACGCPVMTSNRAPMTEIGGALATYIPPDAPDIAADLVHAALTDRAPGLRQRCQDHARQFGQGGMIAAYRDLYVRLGSQCSGACT